MSMGPFAGDLLVCRRKADGTYPVGWMKLEVNKLEVDASDSDVKQRISRSRSSYGQAIKTIIISKPTKIKIDLNEDSHAAAAMVFRGESEPIDIEGGTVTDRVITAAKGLWVELGAENITEGTVVIKSNDGNTTYDEGDDADYVIDYEGGFMLATNDGVIASGPVKASFQHGDIEGTEVKGATVTSINTKLRLLGHEVNNVSQKIRFNASSAVLNPAGGHDLMEPDPKVQSLAGTLESINGAAAFTVRWR